MSVYLLLLLVAVIGMSVAAIFVALARRDASN
jgi:hypothetical protein